jgi:DNA-binding GntR family transcriptional regulator
MNSHPGNTAGNNTNLSTVIYDDLRFQLIVGKLEPGDSLSIRTLAAQYNVSTMPVREALKKLETEKALTGAIKKAYRVPQLGPGAVSNLFHIRAVLEGEAAAIAATSMLKSEIETIHRLTRIVDAAWKQGDAHRFLENNFAFHSTIYRAANNQDLSDIAESLYARSGPWLGRAIRHIASVDEWESHHHEIVQAIESRDSEAARRLMEEDVKWGKNLFGNEKHETE